MRVGEDPINKIAMKVDRLLWRRWRWIAQGARYLAAKPQSWPTCWGQRVPPSR